MAPVTTSRTDVLGYGYAVLLGLGGLIGLLRRGSVMSLLGGGMGALGAAYGASRTSQNADDVVPALGVAWAMFALMGMRFMRSRKFMPAGLGFDQRADMRPVLIAVVFCSAHHPANSSCIACPQPLPSVTLVSLMVATVYTTRLSRRKHI
ncbi:transmembrane proteins 14C-domain-containing protein [Kockovaella imperatae]|uniref:Transmembrane proteins 14C-domain-containing protein n=1 Tax=Kockovaella imperatae TaxID=4999 RepID=A0A1Y1UAG8_9TREE|nr:transmembrane proteins 14C-domain-containing protein [Kockovaella imperatae]ORX34507.1 transmembrane proteins 14C-domain-containing protein [Kockovaella imperatae]